MLRLVADGAAKVGDGQIRIRKYGFGKIGLPQIRLARITSRRSGRHGGGILKISNGCRGIRLRFRHGGGKGIKGLASLINAQQGRIAG